MDRIASQTDEHRRSLGKRALLWAIYAHRPLTVIELSHALRTYDYPLQGFPPAKMKSVESYQPRELVEATGYFLHIYEDTTTIHVHKALREYSEAITQTRVKNEYFNDAEMEMATICLRYLTLSNFSSGHCTTEEDWLERIGKHPFLDYASSFWGAHVKNSGESRFINDGKYPLMKFLGKSEFVSSVTQPLFQALQKGGFPIYAPREMKSKALHELEDPIMPGLHLTAYFDLEEITDEYLEEVEEDPDCLSKSGCTALHLACRLGYVDTVRVLLKHNANPTLGTKTFPIGEAVWNHHYKVVKELLKHKFKGAPDMAARILRQKNFVGKPVIIDAATQGSEGIIALILEGLSKLDNGIETLLHQSNDGHNALHEAAINNHFQIMKRLVDFKDGAGRALLQQKTRGWGDTPLHNACVDGNVDCVKTLLDLGADGGARQSQGNTPLILAAQISQPRHLNVLRVLKGRVDPKVRGYQGRTALHASVDHGRLESVKIFVSEFEDKALLEVVDDWGRTPLFSAVRGRNGPWRQIFTLLFEAGADPRRGDYRNETPLQYLVHTREENPVNIFVGKPEYRDELVLLSIQSNQPSLLAKLLNGPPDSWPTFDGGTSTILHKAVASGYIDVVECILERDSGRILLEEKNAKHQSALRCAISQANLEIINVLVEKFSADVNAPDLAGNGSLHAAAMDGLSEITDSFIRSKTVNLRLQNKEGKTPLDLATECGSAECIKLLSKALGLGYDEVEISSLKPWMEELFRQHPIETDWRSLSATRGFETQIHEKDGDFLYLQTPPLPDVEGLTVHRIAFRTISHDQGFSDLPGPAGSYIDSHTWFEVHKHSADNRVTRAGHLTMNKHKWGEWTDHRIGWDLEHGCFGGGCRWRRPQDQDQVKQYLKGLRTKDRVAVVAKAEWANWTNFVKRAEICVWYSQFEETQKGDHA